MKVRFGLAAMEEFEAAFEYFAARDIVIAGDFHDAVHAAVSQIEQSPQRWPEIEPGLRRYRLDRFKYSLVYRVLSDHVQIIAVAHLSREPRYWISRI
jgi:toxin ParE1/3/4